MKKNFTKGTEKKHVETFGASARGNDLNFIFKIFYVFFFLFLYIRNQPNTKIMPADFKLISPKKQKHDELRATATWHEKVQKKNN